MSTLPECLMKYRRQRSVTGPWRLERSDKERFDACIVIPALAESDNLPRTLDAIAANSKDLLERTLIVSVVNNRIDADSSLRRDNQKTLYSLRNRISPSLHLACVDASSQGLELRERDGVGLARKIGFDLCLPSLDWQKRPFLISLDADTEVQSDYLDALFKHFAEPKSHAVTIPFKHKSESEEEEAAIRRYELYLRSYVYGLKLAGSPYAYISLGSAFACTAEAYIRAGGMNRRLAGEDFYFLQQLRKTSTISELAGTVVYPSARISERVPFGTGRVVQAQTISGTSPFTFCDSASFNKLKLLLDLVSSSWQENAQEIIQRVADADDRLAVFLGRLNFCDVWSQLQNQYKEESQFIKNFHCWFDGLRTRQLLTALTTIDALTELDLINEQLTWGGHPAKETASEQLELLESIQGIQF